MMVGFNDKIACLPFETLGIEKKINSGFVTVKQKGTLYPLKVVYGNDKVPMGTTAWVHGECVKHEWAKEIFEIVQSDGEITKIIIVPTSVVLLLGR